MKAIFPESIDGDLLKLVHLSNGFKMSPGAAPLRVGDVCTSEARVVSVVNSDSGKTVKVQGTVFRDGVPAIEVTSAFLYRGRFTDYENTFESTEETEYSVPILTDTVVGVLASKDWFSWDNDAQPLTAGTNLIFKTKSEMRYKDKASFSSVIVTGAAYIRNQIKDLIKVATVELSLSSAQGNPVLEYLKRHGSPLGQDIPLDNSYSLLTPGSPLTFVTPATNEPYSKVSGDFNPIHINPYFADLALLPGTITHGLWSSAATRRYVETVAADNHPERVVAYNVTFVGMVLPGDELSVKLSHVGQNQGNKIIRVETFNQRDEKVIDGSAEVKQPPTTYGEQACVFLASSTCLLTPSLPPFSPQSSPARVRRRSTWAWSFTTPRPRPRPFGTPPTAISLKHTASPSLTLSRTTPRSSLSTSEVSVARPSAPGICRWSRKMRQATRCLSSPRS